MDIANAYTVRRAQEADDATLLWLVRSRARLRSGGRR